MSAETHSVQAEIRPLRILCVEDQELLGDVLLCLMSQAGHWVAHVSDGIDAWDKISQDLANFDIVITGHLMPRLNGLELVELLHQAGVPGRMIVYTAGVDSDIADRYRALGVSAIVEKTARADDLLRAVSGLIGADRVAGSNAVS
jgi:DNA-binding NarL/FixJ family response regulator